MNILYFTAPWCTPCRIIRPRVERLAADCSEINLEIIDVDGKDREHIGALMTEHNIQSVPVMVADGNKYLGIHQIKDFVTKYLTDRQDNLHDGT